MNRISCHSLSIFLIFLGLSSFQTCFAHQASDSYLFLDIKQRQLQWDIALQDLDVLLQLDKDGSTTITWEEVKNSESDIFALVSDNLMLGSASDACRLEPANLAITKRLEINYASVTSTVHCAYQNPTEATYKLLFTTDPMHRALFRVTTDETQLAHLFSPDNDTFTWQAPTPLATTVLAYLHEGIWHIWTGYDHMAFLIALLLPAVLLRNNSRWQGMQTLKSSMIEVFKVVTAFTLAHSITLSLAATGVADLPSLWVETVIALSVSLAALNVLVPVFNSRRWYLAFALGLIHGFGFAGALSELGLPSHATIGALASFNLGVEVGQLIIVALLIPLLFHIRNTHLYIRGVMPMCAAVIVAVGLMWTYERLSGTVSAALASVV